MISEHTIWRLKAVLSLGILIATLFVTMYLLFATGGNPIAILGGCVVWIVSVSISDKLIEHPPSNCNKKIEKLYNGQVQQE
jgi:hypothetical protein